MLLVLSKLIVSPRPPIATNNTEMRTSFEGDEELWKLFISSAPPHSLPTCDPLVFGPAFAILRIPRALETREELSEKEQATETFIYLCDSLLSISSSNFSPQQLSPPLPCPSVSTLPPTIVLTVPVGSPPWIMKSGMRRWNFVPSRVSARQQEGGSRGKQANAQRTNGADVELGSTKQRRGDRQGR